MNKIMQQTPNYSDIDGNWKTIVKCDVQSKHKNILFKPYRKMNDLNFMDFEMKWSKNMWQLGIQCCSCHLQKTVNLCKHY